MPGAFDYSDDKSQGFEEMMNKQEELSPRERILRDIEEAEARLENPDPEEQSYGKVDLANAKRKLAELDGQDSPERRAA